ncbi:hypothetical protein [Demequina muriae]|uniref:Uncharacterized protein n=1 Tax=Demequina muriae TaxID=3051664 RepID=A0ABT8GHV0_9MICO|nr:hypothetical protein [Demequina sp. EGI L300058]MDN4480997.1 hypothetical protein [Demequina sp. EGI L300058]
MSTTIGTTLPLRRLAAVLVAAEGVTLVAVAAWIGARAVAGEDATAMAAAIAALALGAGIALVWASRSLWRGAAWPRGLAITWQVLQAAAGVTVLEWSVAVGAVVIATAILAAAALLADARREIRATPDDAPTSPEPPAA